MDSRVFWAVSFGASMLACASSPAAAPTPASASAPMAQSLAIPASDLTPDEQARHVLNRLAFGPRPGDVQRVAHMGIGRWIAMQLDPNTIPDSATDRALAELETQRKTMAELIADHPLPQEVQLFAQRAASGMPMTPQDSLEIKHLQQQQASLNNETVAAKTLRAVSGERQLLEVMTDFWENHFSVFAPKSPNPYALVSYDRDVIRPRALGKFRDLLLAVAQSPEMLYYLDNWQSSVDSAHANVFEEPIEARRRRSSDSTVRALGALPHRRPRGLNENYARELMELHTLGVDGGYTQEDVINVARALTGWTIDAPQLGGSFIFRPELHDADQKVVLGHALAPGRGIEDGIDVIDLLSRHPSTARFITTKLVRHFVADDPPEDLVDRCAVVFERSDGDIRETMRCIVTSREFFSRAAYRAKVKTPFELVTSALRALGAEIDTTPRAAGAINRLGQPMFGRLTPDGWPDRGDAWMNTGAILNRINFGFALAAGQIPTARLANWPPAIRLRTASHDAQVNGVIADLLGGDVSPETRSILGSGINPMADGKAQPPAGFAGIVGLALGAPEFQRR